MSDNKSLGLIENTERPATPKRFVREENGAMIIFGLFIFVIMLVAGGMAVDFMRYEHERANIQYTLDRSILAAAALQQPLQPEDVVEDYFSKSDVKDYNLNVTPDQGLNYRTVSATANTTMNTFFVNLLGIDTMKANAAGGAEERVQKVEISLVLDVSGSMGRNGKLANLKTAAKEFVDTLLTAQNEDLVSISIIPYNMQVNAGAAILNEMSVTSEHSYSNCVDFTETQFESTTLGSYTTYQRTGHFDPFYTNSSNHPNTTADDNSSRLFMCPTTSSSEIMLFSQDKTALKNKIDALTAGGNTSIDVGMRWGAGLLDPSANGIVSKVSGVDPVFVDRPRPYTDDDAIKVIVVMTDGVNTTQYTLDDDYKDGPSNVWLDEESTWLSVLEWKGNSGNSHGGQFYSNADFYISDMYTWDNNGDGADDDYWDDHPQNYNHDPNQSKAKRLSWPELWNMVSTRYNAYYHHYAQNWNSNDYWEWRNKVTDQVNQSEKNNRLDDTCDAAKSNAMVIFSIGFEISDSSANIMRNCATSESNFFRVEGTEISDAFNAIAKTIQRLKLTH